MDAAAEHLHSLDHQHYPSSPPRKPRPHSWRMWLSTRVGAAEAALATVFVGGAALAASPSRRRKRHEDDEILPPLNNTSELTLADAWAAVRRAAAAAMAAFEDGPDQNTQQEEQHKGAKDNCCRDADSEECPECQALEKRMGEMALPAEGGASEDIPKECGVDCSDDDDSVALGEKSMSDVTIEETDMAAALLPDSENATEVPDSFPENGEVGANDTEDREVDDEAEREVEDDHVGGGDVLEHRGEEEEEAVDGEVEGIRVVKSSPEEDAEIASVLAALSTRFNETFAQNGGAECVARVKQIGDEAIVFMRDSADMDSKMLAELDDAKVILDDALLRLDAAVRSKVNVNNPEYADAAAAACSVIDEMKDNMKAGVLVEDGSRLLAVFATRVCAAVVECLEDKEGGTWSERVERLAGIATVGVSQLRTVSSKFAEALAERRGDQEKGMDTGCIWPVEIEKLKDVAISHVLQCVALAIAALQIEAAERAQLCSVEV